MGADFISYILEINKNKKPDFEAAKKWINERSNDEIIDILKNVEDYDDEDIKRPSDQDMNNIKNEYIQFIDHIEEAWKKGSRETNKCYLKYSTILITGGMSWGDSPTEYCDYFNKFYYSGAAKIAGFFSPGQQRLKFD